MPMKIVNMHEAKTHLSRLVEEAARGEPFIIAKAGRPVVKVVAIAAESESARRRVGFLAGQLKIPDDFDRIDAAQIERMFDGDQ